MSNKVWILTSSINDYNQHGEYFEAIWFHKPTHEDLKTFGFTEEESENLHYAREDSGIYYDIDVYENTDEIEK